ncbi:MAG: GntR family transcriptional regulator [Cyanobium sp. CACIAM 14]|nr:MAG: GntR family transcriptional regulator [Cyanobium sp. CACIAM 14]
MDAFTAEALQTLPLFASLTPEQCGQLLDRHLSSSHGPDQVLVMEQDWGGALFLLTSGMAKVRTHTSDGDEVVLAVLGPGCLFGEMAALAETARSADVVALTPVTVVKLREEPFEALLRQHAGFALALARLEASRLRDLNQRFAIQDSDATTRLLNALAYLAQRSSAEADPQATVPALAQRELGLLAGLARETASRTLSKLRGRGTVEEVAGGLRLADLEPLIRRGLLPAKRT